MINTTCSECGLLHTMCIELVCSTCHSTKRHSMCFKCILKYPDSFKNKELECLDSQDEPIITMVFIHAQ